MGVWAENLELQAFCGMHPSSLGRGGVKIFKKISWEGPNIFMLAGVALWKNEKFHNLNWVKKAVLFVEIGWVKFFLSLTLPHSRICTRIYIFCLKSTHTQTKSNKNQRRNKNKKKPKKRRKKICYCEQYLWKT